MKYADQANFVKRIYEALIHPFKDVLKDFSDPYFPSQAPVEQPHMMKNSLFIQDGPPSEPACFCDEDDSLKKLAGLWEVLPTLSLGKDWETFNRVHKDKQWESQVSPCWPAALLHINCSHFC